MFVAMGTEDTVSVNWLLINVRIDVDGRLMTSQATSIVTYEVDMPKGFFPQSQGALWFVRLTPKSGSMFQPLCLIATLCLALICRTVDIKILINQSILETSTTI